MNVLLCYTTGTAFCARPLAKKGGVESPVGKRKKSRGRRVRRESKKGRTEKHLEQTGFGGTTAEEGNTKEARDRRIFRKGK